MSRILVCCLMALCVAATGREVFAERRVLHPEMTHLRSGETREWNSFAAQAAGNALRIEFEASPNDTHVTLGLRRVDVKEGWQVQLNKKLLGTLFSDENDMDEVWELPPGTLLAGTNELVVEATGNKSDDVLIGSVWLDSRSRKEVSSEAALELQACDELGNPIPCRFTIVNQLGSLSAVDSHAHDSLAVRAGVVYSANGTASLGLAAGSYTIFCGRGFEYDLPHMQFNLREDERASHQFTLKRVVNTAGMVACDTHVHTFEVSRHGDASLMERMITLAAEGVELAVATDHNVFVDYRPFLMKAGLESYLTPVIGSEVTTRYGHFNVFPAIAEADVPDHQAATWDELFHSIYNTPNIRFAILNHPRDAHSNFTPFAPANMLTAVGKRIDGRRLQAGGIELINSAALQSDPMVVFHDWLTQVNRGLLLTAIGSSDSHEVSRKIVGQGRSYVMADDSLPGKIDVEEAVDSFIHGRVCVSLGLLTELTVNHRAHSGDLCEVDEEPLDVLVKVQGPEWVQADRIELYANGRLIRSLEIPQSQRGIAGLKALASWQLDKPKHDIQLVAVARGPGVRGLYWPIAKPYQPTSAEWNSYVFGSSGIVRIDADRDGRWSCCKDYAQRLVEGASGSLEKLSRSLGDYDAPTAAFAAELWTASGRQIRNADARRVLSQATESVQQGFADFERSERMSLQAAGQRAP